MKYDREEQAILDALEKDELRLSRPSKREIDAIKMAAKQTFKKDRRITIRLYDHDFQGINSLIGLKRGCLGWSSLLAQAQPVNNEIPITVSP